ncbi:MAG: alpha/beta fold hydrolase [Bacteroidota bacterium]
MKKVFKVVKWLFLIFVVLFAVAIGYLRFGRVLDGQIYRADYREEALATEFEHEEMYLSLSDQTSIHAALFRPADSVAVKATIMHHAGNGMSINDSQKRFYAPLIQAGYQIFTYERRGYGQSTGKADNSQTLRRDADEIFDQVVRFEAVKNTPIIIWGTSIGGIFATANASSKNEQIAGLIIESAFSSFPAVAQFYASEINLEKFKFIIPLILNNDFPTNREIKKIDKPVVIIHSVEDTKIPFEFSEDIYANANPESTEFWKIEGKHVRGILNYEAEYVDKFDGLLRK